MPRPFLTKHLRSACIPLLLLTTTFAAAQTQALRRMDPKAHPSFDVAAIKLADPASHRQGFSTEGTHVRLHSETVLKMIMFAYAVHQKQIVNLPSWAGTDPYDVDGLADIPGEPDTEQFQQMLQKLLVERFALKFHRDPRDMSYYAITLARGGPKLTPTPPASTADADQTGNGDGKQMMMKFTANTMDHFALGMQFFLDKPVVNETQLPGRFDFTLRWTPNDLETPDTEAAPTSIFTAFSEQLGLKLEPKRGPVQVIAVDSLSRPTAN